MKNKFFIKKSFFALLITICISLSSYDYIITNNLKKSNLTDNDIVADITWVGGALNNIPFKNGKAVFSTPGGLCLHTIRVRTKDGTILKPGDKNNNDGFIIQDRCGGRSYSLNDQWGLITL